MKVAAVRRCHAKSEHGATGNEDAAGFDLSRGLLAIADGVSTASFSKEWATFLVDRFLALPLLSADPFEVEWWMQAAVAAYQQQEMGLVQSLPAGILREKAEEGSASTFVGVRVSGVGDTRATMRVVAIGDSCLFFTTDVAPKGGGFGIEAFPIQDVDGFEANPVCFQSRRFDRAFHRLASAEWSLCPGAVVVLATDAVAQWILDAGRRGASPLAALRTLLGAMGSDEEWRRLIERCRTMGELRDDDSTVVALRCLGDGAATGMDGWEGGLLGATDGLPVVIRDARQAAFDRARAAGDSALMARLIGGPAVSGIEARGMDVRLVRATADRLAEGKAAVLTALDAPPPYQAAVRRAWDQYADVLEREPDAAVLRATLVAEGILSTSRWQGER